MKILIPLLISAIAGILSWKIPDSHYESIIYIGKEPARQSDYHEDRIPVGSATSYEFDLDIGRYIISIESCGPSGCERSEYFDLNCVEHTAPYDVEWQE